MCKVSVVMAVLNGEKFIARTLESILAQTFRDFEVVIVDDGSQDRTSDIVRMFQDRDSRIRYCQGREPSGNSHARNYGVSIATGAWIAICDADDVWDTDKLRMQVQYRDGLIPLMPVVAIGTYGLVINEGDKVVGMLNAEPTNFDDFCKMKMNHEPFMLNHSSVIFNREVFLEVGGYSSDYIGAEDTELFTRLSEHGVILNMTERLFSYRKHLGSFQLSKTSNQVFNLMRIRENHRRRALGLCEVSYKSFVQSLIDRMTPVEKLLLSRKIHGKYWYRVGAIYSANGHYIRGLSFLALATLYDLSLVRSGVSRFLNSSKNRTRISRKSAPNADQVRP